MTITPGNGDETQPGARRYEDETPPLNFPPPGGPAFPGEVQHHPYPGDRFAAAPGHYGPGYPPVAVRPSNGVATAGGVCGIVAASISWIPIINFFSLVLSIIAVALGAVGFARANKLREQTGEPIGRGMAITGIVIGCVGLVLAAIFIAALGSALNDLTHTAPSS